LAHGPDSVLAGLGPFLCPSLFCASSSNFSSFDFSLGTGGRGLGVGLAVEPIIAPGVGEALEAGDGVLTASELPASPGIRSRVATSFRPLALPHMSFLIQ
jgi:hypothetical protein